MTAIGKEPGTMIMELIKTSKQIANGHENNCIIDTEDLDRCMKHVWRLTYRWPAREGREPKFAAKTKIKGEGKGNIQLHRFILNAGKDEYVIPKDGNATNCRKSNLIKLSKAEWEERNHRKTAGEWQFTDEELKWISSQSVEIGLPRQSVFTRAVRLLMSQSKPEENSNPFD